MMERLLYLSLFLFLTLANKAHAYEQYHLKEMHVTINLSDKINRRFEKHLQFAYNQLGYKIVFDKILSGRAREMVAAGRLDALMIAEKEIEEIYKSILRVPVILARGALILYCNKSVECKASALNHSENIIGVVSGNSMSANYMRNMLASTYTVKGNENLGLMLTRKRLDYILIVNGDKLGNLGGFDDSLYQKIVIYRSEGYHYIHESHKNLLPELTAALQLAIETLGALVEPDAAMNH